MSGSQPNPPPLRPPKVGFPSDGCRRGRAARPVLAGKPLGGFWRHVFFRATKLDFLGETCETIQCLDYMRIYVLYIYTVSIFSAFFFKIFTVFAYIYMSHIVH